MCVNGSLVIRPFCSDSRSRVKYRIVNGKCPLLKQMFIQFVIMVYQVISIIKNLF